MRSTCFASLCLAIGPSSYAGVSSSRGCTSRLAGVRAHAFSPFLLIFVDLAIGPAQTEVTEAPGAWRFDALLVLHAILHFAVLALYLRLAHNEGLLLGRCLGGHRPL